MDKPKPYLYFWFMCLVFKIRDVLSPRANVLREAPIEPGARVLDYGCGPGGYLLPLARLVGKLGEIIALDVHPLALRRIRRIAAAHGLANVKIVQSDCATGLPDGSVDVALLYDVFHGLSEPDRVLDELHRVLRPGGFLSFSDHHMRERDILERVSGSGRFLHVGRGRKTFTFARTD